MAHHFQQTKADMVSAGQHHPMHTVTTIVESFNRPQSRLSEAQLTALICLTNWYMLMEQHLIMKPSPPGVPVLDGGFLRLGFELLNKLLFTYGFTRVDISWHWNLSLCDDNRIRGLTHPHGGRRITITLDPAFPGFLTADSNAARLIFGTIVHDMCHAVVFMSGCFNACPRCGLRLGEPCTIDIVGRTGHGKAWHTLAFHAEKALKAFGFPFADLDRREGALSEDSVHLGLPPSDEIVKEFFSGRCPVRRGCVLQTRRQKVWSDCKALLEKMEARQGYRA